MIASPIDPGRAIYIAGVSSNTAASRVGARIAGELQRFGATVRIIQLAPNPADPTETAFLRRPPAGAEPGSFGSPAGLHAVGLKAQIAAGRDRDDYVLLIGGDAERDAEGYLAAASADATLLVVEAGVTTRQALRAVAHEVGLAPTTLLGAVIVTPERGPAPSTAGFTGSTGPGVDSRHDAQREGGSTPINAAARAFIGPPCDRSDPTRRAAAARGLRSVGRCGPQARAAAATRLAARRAAVPVPAVVGAGGRQFAFMIFTVPMLVHLSRAGRSAAPGVRGLGAVPVLVRALPGHAAVHGAELHVGDTQRAGDQHRHQFAQLICATITMIYIGNLPVAEVSQRRIQKWLSILFVVTVAGGLLGLASPYFQFTAPLEHLLPHTIRSNYYAISLIHPNAAQVQNVLGYQSPRPAAPWSYTNYWANNLSILLVWFCLYMWYPANFRRRTTLVAVMGLAIVTIVYSLNRGLWFGLVASLVFLIAAVARSGDFRSALATIALIPILVVTFLATPLHTIVSSRASHGTSNDIRAFLDADAFKGALASPIMGWGGTRKATGSAQSIAVGPSAACPKCGSAPIGSTGQIWEVMFDEGFVGVILYVGFFLMIWWQLRRDRSAIGAAARLVVWLALLYTVFYNNLPVALTLVMISIVMSWRNLIPPARAPNRLRSREIVDSAERLEDARATVSFLFPGARLVRAGRGWRAEPGRAFTVAPSIHHARLLLPRAPGDAAATALRVRRPAQHRGRWGYRGYAGLMSLTGGRGLGPTFVVEAPDEVRRPGIDDHLGEVLAEPVAVAMHPRRPGPIANRCCRRWSVAAEVRPFRQGRDQSADPTAGDPRGGGVATSRGPAARIDLGADRDRQHRLQRPHRARHGAVAGLAMGRRPTR